MIDTHANDNYPERLLKLKEVRAITSLGTSTIYRRLAAGTFPKPRVLSEACVRWRESEILAWIKGLPVAA
ncbi:helix-turn-helix transcriptional regulator [Rhizobium laguerreae]|uniref:helix-turn-helix transcriptional regulator n=1 Tax=Rhizobium laguerreae TaxID=1076926 RepID=UPI001C900273|nr:AlpA family phage regulatory protein [Rhizobium laguerreae]MBY3564109.1 AlpA family phage regulatory protein [Rhizobium laguerreae]